MEKVITSIVSVNRQTNLSPSLSLFVSVRLLQSRAVGRLHFCVKHFKTIVARKPQEQRMTPIQWEEPEEFHTVSTDKHLHTLIDRTVIINMYLRIQWCEAGVGQDAGWVPQTTPP